MQLLEFVGNRRRVCVAGCAGSGKTSLAAAKARQLAEQGEGQILLLAYNLELVAYLAQCLKDLPAIKVSSFHGFCRERCLAAGIVWPDEAHVPKCFWNDEVPQLLDAALEEVPCAYDAILVDEAQDFQSVFWCALEKALKPDGWYYIFYDPDQNVYQGDLAFPVEDQPYLLQRNCRSTRNILNAIAERTGKTLRPKDDIAKGEPVIVEKGRTPAQRRRLLGKVLHEWIRKEGLSENQIVVLGGHSLAHTSMENETRVGSFTIKERGIAASGLIPYHTYMSFKGCEADAVILLDVDPTDARWSPQGLYTAMTRARHLLAIVEIG